MEAFNGAWTWIYQCVPKGCWLCRGCPQLLWVGPIVLHIYFFRVRDEMPECLMLWSDGQLLVTTGYFYGIVHSINGVFLVLVTGILGHSCRIHPSTVFPHRHLRSRQRRRVHVVPSGSCGTAYTGGGGPTGHPGAVTTTYSAGPPAVIIAVTYSLSTSMNYSYGRKFRSQT